LYRERQAATAGDSERCEFGRGNSLADVALGVLGDVRKSDASLAATIAWPTVTVRSHRDCAQESEAGWRPEEGVRRPASGKPAAVKGSAAPKPLRAQAGGPR